MMQPVAIAGIVIAVVVVGICLCAFEINRRWTRSEIYGQMYHHHPMEEDSGADTSSPERDDKKQTPKNIPSSSPYWGRDANGRVGRTDQVIHGKTFTPPISSYPVSAVEPPVLSLDDSQVSSGNPPLEDGKA